MIELTQLITGLRAGELSISDYVDHLEARFQEVEPLIEAFVPEPDRFARLRRDAATLLERYPAPESRPPLFGIAVGVKDIFHVKGFTTRAGSQVSPELLQGPEAAVVTALRNAGALILGKTVTTEFAYFAPGPTRNPHNPAHTPGGSSSGSAAAVAAGLCPLALGTQTIGSIIRPASFCGVVGYKPSYDRVSREASSRWSLARPPASYPQRRRHGPRGGAILRRPASCRRSRCCAERPLPGHSRHAGMVQPDSRAAERTATRFRCLSLRYRHAGDGASLLVAAEAAEVHRHWFAAEDHNYRSGGPADQAR